MDYKLLAQLLLTDLLPSITGRRNENLPAIASLCKFTHSCVKNMKQDWRIKVKSMDAVTVTYPDEVHGTVDPNAYRKWSPYGMESLGSFLQKRYCTTKGYVDREHNVWIIYPGTDKYEEYDGEYSITYERRLEDVSDA